ncbi:TonB-dependent receptor [Emcibacter sp.]|uniref:TonB-dependent receptor n=1 Tax=Emcibacter sp. TaxID=1979954 RepID=UPI002AA6D47B|nr:TonB-dependent receptor [Emcibacter sp.]
MLKIRNKKQAVRLMVSTIIATGAFTGVAAGADAAGDSEGGFVLEEIVVTAQKREQNLQDTPISLAAFDREALEMRSIKDIADVTAYTPNVQITPSPGGNTGATVAIRGATTVNPAVTWEPAVGIYIDGVFVAKNVGGLFDVAELERIEVLRGPQGALYGKNTTGGAINLITRKPSGELGGYVKGGAGNYGSYEFGASIDLPKLGDILSVNVAYNKRERDGFYDNVESSLPGANPPASNDFNSLDAESLRVAALAEFSESFSAYYTFDWSRRNNSPSFGQFELGTLSATYDILGPAPIERQDEGSRDGTFYDTSKTQGHALHLTWDISDNMTLKSITAYREMQFHDNNDYDGVPYTGFHAERDVDHSQTSQELQLVGSMDSLTYVLGLFYFNEKADAFNPYDFGFGIPVRNYYGVESNSYAAFGQVDWAIDDHWTLTLGMRYTKEDKDAYIRHPDGYFIGADTFEFEDSDTWNNFSPSATISYKLNEDVNFYAKVARGWKAGGFNGEAVSAAVASVPYDEETMTSYEIGMKARWMDGRVQTNIAGFYNKVNDLQLSNFLGAYSQIENAGESSVKGIEFEGILLITESLTAFLNYGYMKGDYQDFSVGGVQHKDTAKFPYTPEHKISVGLEHSVDLGFGELRSRVDYSWTDEQYFFHEEASALLTKGESYDLLNARIALDIPLDDRRSLELSVWGKNLTDAEYRLHGIPITSNFYAINYYGDPRTFGFGAKINF